MAVQNDPVALAKPNRERPLLAAPRVVRPRGAQPGQLALQELQEHAI